MLTYKYYKFPNKNVVPKFWPNNVSVIEIGPMRVTQSVYDSLGNVISTGTEDSAWHINICYSGNADLSHIEQYEIFVKTPKRIWFGQQT